MKLATFTVLIFVFAFLSQVQPASAWAAPNHYAIVEEVYNSLPAEKQEKLSLSEMKSGADDPDFKFFDFSYHHYPASQGKANYWLEKGGNYYQNGDYDQASYCFGVASHYLSDSVCPPHCGDDSGYKHTQYEIEAVLYQPHITLKNGDVNSALIDDSQMGKKAWDQWVKTGDDKYIQEYLNKAAEVSYYGINSAI
jgi:hypothetical protein